MYRIHYALWLLRLRDLLVDAHSEIVKSTEILNALVYFDVDFSLSNSNAWTILAYFTVFALDSTCEVWENRPTQILFFALAEQRKNKI